MPHDIVKLGYFCGAAGCPRAQLLQFTEERRGHVPRKGVIVWAIKRC